MENETKPPKGKLKQASSNSQPSHDEDIDIDLSETQQGGYYVTPRLLNVSRGSNEWHPTEDPAFRHVRSETQPSGDDPSIVRDGGLSLQLSDIAEGRSREQTHDLIALGAHLEEESVLDLSDSLEIEVASDSSDFLDVQIMTARVASAEKKEMQFLPFNRLEDLITPANIFQELRRAGLKTDVRSTMMSIWKTVTLPRGVTSRQKIFTILCMIRKAAEIVSFIEEEIYDQDLPFIFKTDPKEYVYHKIEKDIEKPILLFQKATWPTHDRDSFRNYQWELLAPFFKLSYGKGQRVLHFPLEDRTVLPFIEDVLKDGEQIGLTREGGFSVVRKVKIHPAHHNKSNTQSEEDVYFAVKELKVSEDSALRHGKREDREALALKRFNEQTHPHLIRLLATYTREGRFHMVFPWADGNLRDLWKKSSFRNFHSSQDPKPIQWLSKQILGLACALEIIHYCPEKSNIRDPDTQEAEKPHGRHGDLKPENILWFQKNKNVLDDQSSRELMIGDFGFADFRGPHSRDYVRKSTIPGVTDTYKAPEIEVMEVVSQSYDIWSFGCILLEFVVWFLQDWKTVDEFARRRAKDSREAGLPLGAFFPRDTFFKLVRSETLSVAKPKNSVAEEFAKLRALPSCTDYLLDLLQCIQLEMLRVEPGYRATINAIVGKLKAFDERCSNDALYCTSKTEPPPKIPPDSSEIHAALNESPNLSGLIKFKTPPLSADGSTSKEDKEKTSDDKRESEQNNGLGLQTSSNKPNGYSTESEIAEPRATPSSSKGVLEPQTPPIDLGSTTNKISNLGLSKSRDAVGDPEVKRSKRDRTRDWTIEVIKRCFGNDEG